MREETLEPVRVAIVDPHGVMRRGLQALLRTDSRWRVIGMATDRAGGRDLIAAHKPDVAIIDLFLDETGDTRFVRDVLLESPGSSVIVFADESAVSHVEEAIGAGAAGFLLKTATPEDVVSAVGAVVAGHVYLQPAVTRAFIRALTGRGSEDGLVLVTPREMEILQLIANGLSTKEAATALNRSEATIKSHVGSVFKKLGASHRAHAVAMALRLRLIR